MRQDIEVWPRVFQELIQEVKPQHQWTLTLDQSLVPGSLQPGWMQYQQCVFARFQCSGCSRTWASAHVHVLFHMHWSKRKSKGQVKMRVFAQRCQKCSQPPFEFPEFTDENTSRILQNLVFRILKKCYREGFKSMQEIPTVKDSHVEGPHDSDNCEACLQGFCAQRALDRTTQPPVSPSCPTRSLPAPGPPTHKPCPARSSTTVGTVTGGTRVKQGRVPPNPWFPEPRQIVSPRANPPYPYPAESRIQVPPASVGACPRRPMCRNVSVCCCLIILILIVVVVIVVKTYI